MGDGGPRTYRYRRALDSLRWQLVSRAGLLYLGAISLVGIETVAVLLTFATAWPIALPLVVVSLGAFYFVRQFGKRFRDWFRRAGE